METLCGFSKCKVWERNRRDRMKVSFTELEKVLPLYDPTKTISRLEVLRRAVSCIEDLKHRNRTAISENGASEETSKKI